MPKPKPKGYYTKDEVVHPIFDKHPHVKPIKKGTSRLGIPKRTVRQIQASRTPKARSIDARLKAKIAKSEEEWAKQPNRRDLKGIDYPQRKGKREGAHTHWMVTYSGATKYTERKEHNKSLKHTDVYSQRRHSLETGAMQSWLKKRNLKMYDANTDRYEREVIKPQVERNKALVLPKTKKITIKRKLLRKKREYRGQDIVVKERKEGRYNAYVDGQLIGNYFSPSEAEAYAEGYIDKVRNVSGILAKTKTKPKRHLQVIWTRNHLLKHKEFPMEKEDQAFNWYWRVNADQLVLREEGKYGHSFSESNVSEYRQKNPTKEGYKQEFKEWLKDSLTD